MNIALLGTNIDITEALRAKVYAEFEKFKKVLDPHVRIAVEIGKINKHHKQGEVYKAEAKIVEPKAEYFANFITENLYTSITTLADELFEKVTKSKAKHRSLSKRGGGKIKELLKLS